MRRLLRSTPLLGSLIVVAAGACLVFDGRQATTDSDDAGAGDGGEPGDASMALSDGRARDDAPSDGGVLPPEGSTSNGVVCNEESGGTGRILCEGGVFHKCCAFGGGPMSAAWVYPKPPCQPDCYMSKSAPIHYYGYACDDTDDCEAGTICCALAGAGSSPFTSSTCMSACPPSGMQLCQHDGSCTLPKTCKSAQPEYLPPGYSSCQK
jgi:hypothetical protein